MVPRGKALPCGNLTCSNCYVKGNTYCIENIAEREAKLVFTQACKTAPTEEEVQFQQQMNNRRSLEMGLQ
jgi:hypothetical protein